MFQQLASTLRLFSTRTWSFKCGTWVARQAFGKNEIRSPYSHFDIVAENVKNYCLNFGASFRPYWRCYYSNTDAIIYVVDSMDRDRIGISKQELVSMLEVNKHILRSNMFYNSDDCLYVFRRTNLRTQRCVYSQTNRTSKAQCQYRKSHLHSASPPLKTANTKSSRLPPWKVKVWTTPWIGKS